MNVRVVIKKGKHYCSLLSRLRFFPFFATKVKELKLTVRVTPEMIVLHNNMPCKGDSNKIFGITGGIFKRHHKESYRICYVSYPANKHRPERVQFLFYDYVNGRNMQSFVTKTYNVGDLAVITHKLPKPITGRKLMPYSGGDCAAPHDVKYHAICEYLK